MFQINQANCVCCHNCRSECPMQAINYVGTKYQIDPDKCVECGLCAKVCHTQSIHNTDDVVTIVPHDTTELTADVVVVGGGTGLVAAVRAAQLGKKVILVEKAMVLGGNTDYAHAYFPVYTKWHEEAGMPDCREAAIAHYLNVTNNVLDPEVVRTAVYGTGEFFDWLCEFGTAHNYYHLVNLGDADAHGPIYGPGLLDYANRSFDNLNCRDDAIGPGWGGTYVKYTMLDAIRDQKLPVDILLGTGATHLELDDNGAIKGLMCEDAGGSVHITTPTVILQCGGFGKNDDLIKEFAPWFFAGETEIHRFSVPTDTGDGIIMLRELGVEPDPNRMNISMFGPKHHPFNNCLADIALEPEMLQINLNGKRWVDETVHLFGMTPKIPDQPKEISYSIQSVDVIKMIAERFINNPAFTSRKKTFETWFEELNDEATLEIPVKKADTLEELAVLCGMPTDALVETIAKYNEFCAAGVDADFGKGAEKLIPVSDHGPYYAIYGQRFSEASLGGVTVDGQCRCVRNDGTPIPGLYAGGDATSAFHIKGTLAVVSELTWGVASAFTSGKNAVDYIDSKCQ